MIATFQRQLEYLLLDNRCICFLGTTAGLIPIKPSSTRVPEQWPLQIQGFLSEASFRFKNVISTHHRRSGEEQRTSPGLTQGQLNRSLRRQPEIGESSRWRRFQGRACPILHMEGATVLPPRSVKDVDAHMPTGIIGTANLHGGQARTRYK